jgi:hypothetical protein
MESVSQTQKKYGSRAMIVAIVIALMLILIDMKPVGKGLVLGTIFSVINFVLIGQTLPMRLSKSKRGAFLISLTSIVFRYAILAIPLVVAAKFEQFELAAAILGIFMVQLIILAEGLFDLFTSRENQT